LKAHLCSKLPFESAANMNKNCPLLNTKSLWKSQSKTNLQERHFLWLNHRTEQKSPQWACVVSDLFTTIFKLLKY